MARVLCAYSGIEFKVEHFPAYFGARECFHPIFTLPKKKLLAHTSRWAEGSLSSTENYLYYLALLNSSGLIEWRVPAIRTEHTDSLIAQNMQSLLFIIGKLDCVSHPAFIPPRFVITPETKDLGNTKYWIQLWNENYIDFQTGYKTSTQIEKVSRRETALEKLIKDKTKSVESYAGIIAEWAALAGEFPSGTVEFANRQIALSDYWKLIIRKCAKAESIFEIPDVDIDDLIEHCEENIDHGSIYAHSLMHLLREGKRRKNNFLGLGNDDGETTFQILDSNASVEDANKLVLINSAPLEMPRIEQYPSKIAFIIAKGKYDMAVRYREEMAAQELKDSQGIPSSVQNRRIEDNL